MKTPKQLYPSERIIYHPEVSVCLVCGGSLMLMNTLLWNKTVQTLDGVVSIASRPACCADPDCAGASMRLRSAAGQQVAPPRQTYGYDVLVRLGWLRQTRCATYAEIHAELSPQVQLSEAQVRYLYQHSFLPLLACLERQQAERLNQVVEQYGGLVLALDGLAPEGGEPQLWLLHELLSGVVLRSGWLSRQDQAAFEGFLLPLREFDWPIRAVLSDKQRGLLPAIASVLPHVPHQFCQSHYLRNLAEPLASADSALSVVLRQAVRLSLGPLLLRDQPPEPTLPGVLTMTGLLAASPLVAEAAPAAHEPSRADAETPAATLMVPSVNVVAAAAPSPEDRPAAPLPAAEPAALVPDEGADPAVQSAAAIVTQMLRRTRYLLTLKGRPPLRLAGIELVAELEELIARGQRWLAHREHPLLAQLVRGLQNAVTQVRPTADVLRVGATWLAQLSAILEPTEAMKPTAAQVAQELQAYLDHLDREVSDPLLLDFQRHLRKVSRSYWPGLFHCYDHPDIPRTNNGLESHFRDTQRRLLRTTGQKGRTRRILHRSGAWELLGLPPTEAASLAALRQIAPEELADERQRLRQHQERFRLHTRSPRQTKAQLDRLEQEWLALPPTATA
jgi:hypothetical protein